MEFTLRESKWDDLPQIVKLLSDDDLGCFREEYCLPQCYIEAYRNICEDKNSRIIVASCERGIIGCMQITFTQYLSHKGSVRATIENVRVAKEMRNLGIGTRLICHAISLAKEKNASIVQLTTDKKRAEAKKFYEKNGFANTHDGMKFTIK